MNAASIIYKIRQCSKCQGDTANSCLSCTCDMCQQCTENHVHDLKMKDHDVVMYREKSDYIQSLEYNLLQPNNIERKYRESCQVQGCPFCAEKSAKSQWLGTRGSDEILQEQVRKNNYMILNEALLERCFLLTGIKADIKACEMYSSEHQSKMLSKAHKLKRHIDKALWNIDRKHKWLKEKTAMIKYLTCVQLYEKNYENSSKRPIQFLMFSNKTHIFKIGDSPCLRHHVLLYLNQESPNMTDLIIFLRKIQKIQVGKRYVNNNSLFKLMVVPELHQNITGIVGTLCSHISHVTSDLVWVSDDKKNLTLIDKGGESLHHRDDLYSGVLSGSHTVNGDHELVYIDSDFNIKKLSEDFVPTIFIERNEFEWTPVSLFWSRITSDLLVGLKRFSSGKVLRYDQTGILTQTVQHDNNGEIFKVPYYIAENKNGDIVVSCSLRGVVVTDRDGNFRFFYDGNNAGSQIWSHGICTDALFNILVNDLSNHSVHIIDKDGNFLSYLLTRPLGILHPCSLSYDINTHRIWIGSFHNNSICVYNYISRQNALTDHNQTNPDMIYTRKEIKRNEHVQLQEENEYLSECISVINRAGVSNCCHITCMTLNRIWINDNRSNFILTNLLGNTMYQIWDSLLNLNKDNREMFNGFHTMSSDGDLIYIDEQYTVKKLSKDLITSSSLIKRTDSTWMPLCVHSCQSTRDLLVGMWRILPMKGRVVRYNHSGELKQIIQHDQNELDLYRAPIFITENNNGDVVVSYYDFSVSGALVVTEHNGNYRFQYTGNPPESGLAPFGICTDNVSNILVCDGRTNKVHIINSNGHFLAYFQINPETIENPCSLSFNVNTQCLCVGSRHSKKK